MADPMIGPGLGTTGPRARNHEDAARLTRDAQDMLDSVAAGKRAAALRDPQRDRFAENARTRGPAANAFDRTKT